MADTDVLVVGAGPTGLLLAAELVRRGVDCELVDAHDAPLGWDRATIVHSRSMQIFEALGIEDRFLAAGVKSPRVIVRADGRELGVMDFGDVETPYRFDLGISENATEEIVTAYLEARGGAVTRGARLVGLEQDAEGVTATLDRGGETAAVRARWLVGCDGFKSSVRRLAGIEYPGTDIETQWAVFDAALEGWTEPPEVQVAHLDEHPVVLTPLPGERYRVYMRPASADGDLVAQATSVLARYEPGVKAVDVDDPVRFECHARIAAAYRAGRILLAGDAAHTCTPAEGHGMNTGLQDAFNLGWKLALVAPGIASPKLLDSYEAERRPVAELVVASGNAAEAIQATSGAAARAERDAAISEVFADPESGHREAVAACELNRAYPDSPIVAGAAPAGVAPGDLFPETGPEPLHRHAHRAGHTVLVLAAPARAAEAESLAADLGAELEGSPVVEAVEGIELEPPAAERLGVTAVTLLALRPDRFVGLRADTDHSRALHDYVERLTG
jgi:2-polyprenyl-6-methoxyphenol hydroxylase-like FAD-dependent oxidoreductase